jgi:hypothetical protein
LDKNDKVEKIELKENKIEYNSNDSKTLNKLNQQL